MIFVENIMTLCFVRFSASNAYGHTPLDCNLVLNETKIK